MVARATIKKTIQITVPEGATVVTLSVKPETVISAGAIPDTLEGLDMRSSRPLFEEGAIPPSLKSLLISSLVKGSHYSSSLDLFVRDYTGDMPLPTDTCARIFVHNNYADKISKDVEHYLFFFGSSSPCGSWDKAYTYGIPTVLEVFGEKLWTVKRTPIVPDPEPVVIVSNPIGIPGIISDLVRGPVGEPGTSLADEQIKLVQAKVELTNEKKKLVQAKQKLVEEQLKALRAVCDRDEDSDDEGQQMEEVD